MLSYSYCKSTVCLLLTLGIYSLKPAVAAETETTGQPLTLPTVIVEDNAIDARPGTTEITEQTVEEQVDFNLKDVFRNTPEVSVGGGSQAAQRIYVNGVEGSNLNITVDGARNGRNLHQHRGGFTGPDPDLLKRVAVETTSGVTSGPGALGGSIRMTTVDAQDLLHRSGKNQGFGGQIKTGWNSVDHGKHGDIRLYGTPTPKLGILVNVSADNRNDYRTGGERHVTGSGGQDRNYLLKFSLLDWHQHDVRLNYNHAQNSGLYSRGSYGSDMGYVPEDPTGPSVRLRQKSMQGRLTLEDHWQPDSPWLELNTHLYQTRNRLEYPGSSIKTVRTKENGFDISNLSQFELLHIRHHLTIGTDWFNETAYTHALDMNDTETYPALTGQAIEYDNRNWGVFVENKMETGPLITTLGLRLDDYDSDYGPIQLDDHTWSPALRLDYLLNNGLNLFGGYSEAARAGGDIPVVFLARLNRTTAAGNGKLDPETSRQREIGARYTLTRWPLMIQLRAFETHIDNTIQTIGRGNIPLGDGDIFNGDKLKIKGWQFNTRWQSARVTSTLSLNIHQVKYGNDDSPGVIRRLTAPAGDTLVWDSRWQVREDLMLGYTFKWVGKLKDVPDDEPERDGYQVHGLRGQWQARRDLVLRLAIDNLFDRKYASQTSLYSPTTGIVDEPGRDIRLNLTYTF